MTLKRLSFTLFISIFSLIQANAQDSTFSLGNLVKRYAIKHNILLPNTIISDNNSSIIFNQPLPDIRCFDADGKAIYTLNCMASIEAFVDSVNADKVKLNPNGENLKDYLENNTILTLGGDTLKSTDLPHKKYYIFYSYQYKDDQHIPAKDLVQVFQFLRNANENLDKSKAIFYNVCITGVAFNNTKFYTKKDFTKQD